MKQSNVFRSTGILGLILFVLINLEIPLYFVYTPTPSGTPPANIILLRVLVDMFVVIAILGFFSGFKSIISRFYSEHGGLGTFIFSCALAFSISSLVADSIQAGSLWAAGTNPSDPTAVGYGAEGALLIYGPINRLIFTCILSVGGLLVLKTKLAPMWTSLLAFAAAIYNLCFVPTLFFMTTPLDFYSVNGWNIPIAAGFFFLWIFVVSIYMIRMSVRSNAVTSR